MWAWRGGASAAPDLATHVTSGLVLHAAVEGGTSNAPTLSLVMRVRMGVAARPYLCVAQAGEGSPSKCSAAPYRHSGALPEHRRLRHRRLRSNRQPKFSGGVECGGRATPAPPEGVQPRCVQDRLASALRAAGTPSTQAAASARFDGSSGVGCEGGGEQVVGPLMSTPFGTPVRTSLEMLRTGRWARVGVSLQFILRVGGHFEQGLVQTQ